YIPHHNTLVRASIGILLVLLYFVYILLTLQASSRLVTDGHGTVAHDALYLCRFGLPEKHLTILVQLALGLALLIAGAKGFIHGIESASKILDISALLLSLLIIPIATEQPEMFNTILWIRKRKDTLAFGNITGAMVFQGTLLPAIGIMLTPWEPRPEVVGGIFVTLLAAGWLKFMLRRGQLQVWHIGVNGALYVGYLTYALA
ncbi:MAG: sodium:calcium antiporter, partial [Burkholderiales bacterium]